MPNRCRVATPEAREIMWPKRLCPIVDHEVDAFYTASGAPSVRLTGRPDVSLVRVGPGTVTERSTTVRAIDSYLRGRPLSGQPCQATMPQAVEEYLRTFPDRLWVAYSADLQRNPSHRLGGTAMFGFALWRLQGVSFTADFPRDLPLEPFAGRRDDVVRLYLYEGSEALLSPEKMAFLRGQNLSSETAPSHRPELVALSGAEPPEVLPEPACPAVA